jgi:hypothetical protein
VAVAHLGNPWAMSYDLYLLRKDEIGDDPSAAFERLEDVEDREPTSEEERELRRLAADLQAASLGVDVVESSRGFVLQLGYEAQRPVTIDISASEITMSWSYGADEATPALDEVRLYLPVFERHGYLAYDPQLERLFDVDRDSRDAADIHDAVRGQMVEMYGEERRSWWSRILGR